MGRTTRLLDLVERLRALHGPPEPLVSTDPYELILFENAAYLVDDATRRRVWERLGREVGTSPAALLGPPEERLVAAIADGGMHPHARAGKLRDCARLAEEIGLHALRAAVGTGGREARRLLKRFPGIGDPGADRLLLVAGSLAALAPESNALRVLVRLGYGKESKSYAQTYRSATEAAHPELPAEPARLLEAHQLLRRHGQELCKRSDPCCEVCPLAKSCAYASG